MLNRTRPFPFLTLLVAPLLALHWSTPWMTTAEHEVGTVVLVGPADAGADPETVDLVPRAEGTHPHDGVRFRRGWRLRAELPELRLTRAGVQADAPSSLELLGSTDGVHWEPLWNVPAMAHRRGLVTRTSPPFEPTAPLRFVALTSRLSDGMRSVGRVALEYQVADYPPFATLAFLLWPLWGGLALAAGYGPTRAAAGGILSVVSVPQTAFLT